MAQEEPHKIEDDQAFDSTVQGTCSLRCLLASFGNAARRCQSKTGMTEAARMRPLRRLVAQA